MKPWRAVFFLTIFLVSSADVRAEDAIQITSPAFEAGENIPSQFTCDGKNISPALEWSGVPKNTWSVALIMDDPDAPAGTWVHWVLYNLPPTVTNLPQDIPPIGGLANGEVHGKNSFGALGYGGPCPPPGDHPHRYIFRIYALDSQFRLSGGATKEQVMEAMQGRVLAEGKLIGRYERER